MLDLPVCSYYAPGFHALKARAVQQEIAAARATCTGSSAPAPVVSSAAAAPPTADLPATQLLPPLPPPLLALCVRGRHHPAESATSADLNRRPPCIVLLDPPNNLRV